MINHIRGIVVPIITPLKPDESLDKSSLRSLVRYLLNNGVHGLWVSGTTGEFANLDNKTRLETMEIVTDEVNGKVPIIANISCPSTETSIKLGQSAKNFNFSGLACTPPYYYDCSQEEILDHYRYISSELGSNIWVYNIPQNVKSTVNPISVAALAEENLIEGIKDSSGHGENIAQLNNLCESKSLSLLRFIGSTYRITSTSSLGLHGAIPGIANLIPKICSSGWESGEKNDLKGTNESNLKISIAQKILSFSNGKSSTAASFSGIKSALKYLGVIKHDTMSKPLKSLSAKEQNLIPALLKTLDLIP
ncbi:MAG: dihydrodipicolinate synthase family protein [SAR202 cluster bacterium]|nr:dihydrodipicolinate synthase family protein [SAR202 cluster bacterium]